MRPSIKAIVIAAMLAATVPASASVFSGWKPFKRPLDPVKKAGDELSKAISGGKQTLPPAAQQQVTEIEKKADTANKEFETAAETLAIQRDNSMLAAIGLCVTNALTLIGLLRGRARRRLEFQKLELEVQQMGMGSPEGRLRRLDELKTKKLLSDDEYQRQRAVIVTSL